MTVTISLDEARAKEAEQTETLEQNVLRLSFLSSLEYEQIREAEAKRLNVRVSVLDEEVKNIRFNKTTQKSEGILFPVIEPWHEPVDVACLLDDIYKMVKFYIICNTEIAIAITLWIAFTWFIDHVNVAPIAMITAPEKRCGKSQLLTIIGKLASRPLQASNISPAAIFRVIEAHSPTLLIDEADAFLKNNEEARGIINSGHTRSTAHVIRVVGDNHEPKQFSTWGAKAISGIGKQADTLMDRSIVLELRRKLPHEKVERLRYAEERQFNILKRKLARFAQDYGIRVGQARPELPESLNDRAQDNWEPLLAIADIAGGHWPNTARNTALKISGKEQDSVSLSVELLQDIKEIFKQRYEQRIKTVDLIDMLCEDDMRPWLTYNRGKPITPRQIANILKEYKIEPKSVRIGAGVGKGYDREQFDDAFNRYIPLSVPPSLSVTELQNDANTEPERDRPVSDSVTCNGYINKSVTPKSALDKACNRVTDNSSPFGKDIEVI